jgi:hypothetical protein
MEVMEVWGGEARKETWNMHTVVSDVALWNMKTEVTTLHKEQV